MPTAYPFSTLGKLNGLPGCVPKVDVSGFDYWTTASGYNKDDFDASTAVTQEQIDQSLHKIGRLFWNLYRVTCRTGYLSNPSSILTEVIVGEWDITELDFDLVSVPIEPKDRGCGGPLSDSGSSVPNLGYIDLRLDTGFSRFYNGDTDDEANFIGYGGAFIDTASSFDPNGTIRSAYIPIGGDPESILGGYSTDNFSGGVIYEYAYVDIQGIHFLWLGRVDDPGSVDPDWDQGVDSETLRAWFRHIPTDTTEQAQITGLEFWEY
jgi:hypothetical protein